MLTGIDLHVHTTASDGTVSPADVVRMASEKGLVAVAITDHDTVAGVTEALAEGRRTGVEVIPGVELSVHHPRCGSLHVLGYWIDTESGTLLEGMEAMVRGREVRNQRIIQLLRGLGAGLEWDTVKKIAGDAVMGRPHIARALLEAGHVESIDEAFDRLLARGQPAYAERKRMTAGDALRLIAAAGGVAVLAHPGDIRLPREEVEEEIVRLGGLGLGGIEVYYPSHSNGLTTWLKDLASRTGLVLTGGTDFHGAIKPGVELGSQPVPVTLLGPLRELSGRTLSREVVS